MEQLYVYIRNRRKELGMTQDQLASKLGYKDRSMIAKIEAGHVDISIEMLKKIAFALNIEPIVLFDLIFKEENQ